MLTRASIDCYAQNNIRGLGTSLLVNLPSEFDLIKFLSPLVTPHWKELRKLTIHSVGLFTIICVT